MNTLITVKLTELKGKKIEGIVAQVTNPEYLATGSKPKWRTLRKIREYTERGVKWISLSWQMQSDSVNYDCGFTGCTIRRNSCAIQLKPEDYKTLFQS